MTSVAKPQYRPEIDGMRAISVIAVVLFHAHVFALPGGFLGVDVFFVISGFLITKLLIEEHSRTGRISILHFYERRVRRLLPAFYTVCLVTAGLCLWLYAPGDLEDFGASAFFAILFSSNIYFWRNSGYFSADSEIAPLLHTWSLSVEEQFYLFWPLFMIVVLRFAVGRWLLPALVVLGGCLSIALAQYASVNYPQPSFYLMPTRAFELLIGAFSAQPLLPRLRSLFWANLLVIGGISAIILSFVFLHKKLNLPGFWTLVPCLGAAAILFAGHTSSVARVLLANPVMVFIGLVSYSWYLWHWPLFAIWRYVIFRDPSLLEACILIALSFGLAVLSWGFVERPLRYGRGAGTSKQGSIIRVGLIPGVLLAVLLGSLTLLNGLPARMPADFIALERQTEAVSPTRRACHLVPRARIVMPDLERCTGGDEDKLITALLWGDSHASHYSPYLNTLGRAQGWAFRVASKSGCPPFLNTEFVPESPVFRGDCQQFNDMLLTYLLNHPEITDVWLTAHWPSNKVRLDGDIEALARHLEEMRDKLETMGRRVHIFGVIPSFPFSADSCFLRQTMFPSMDITCEMSEEKTIALRELNSRLIVAGGDSYLDILPLLCPTGQNCQVHLDGHPAYLDAHHFNAIFAGKILPGALAKQR